MMPLGHAAPRLRRTGQAIALDDRDPREVVGEDPGRDEPGHARSDHHRVAAAESARPG
jgi:hypothetical protein